MRTENFKIPYCIDANGSLTVVLEGRPYTVVKSAEHYDYILQAVREGREKDVYSRLANRPLARGKAEYRDGRVYLNGQGVATEFSDYIAKRVTSGLPIGGWLAFCERVHQNVEPYVIEQLHNFLIHDALTVTASGEILGFKSVTSDFKDHHTESMTYEIGKAYTMSRSLVCSDPRQGCAPGLHFGALSYTQELYSGCPVFLVKVTPEDVVSVPEEYQSRKCRGCRFEVVRLLTAEEIASGVIPEQSLRTEDDDIPFAEDVVEPVVVVPSTEYGELQGVDDPKLEDELEEEFQDLYGDDDDDDSELDQAEQDFIDELDAEEEEEEDDDEVPEFLRDETDDSPEDTSGFPSADDDDDDIKELLKPDLGGSN